MPQIHKSHNIIQYWSHTNPLHTVMSYDILYVLWCHTYDIIIHALLTQALSICQSPVHWSDTCHRWAAVSRSSGHFLPCLFAVGPSVLPLAERRPSSVAVGAQVVHGPEGGCIKSRNGETGNWKQVMRWHYQWYEVISLSSSHLPFPTSSFPIPISSFLLLVGPGDKAELTRRAWW